MKKLLLSIVLLMAGLTVSAQTPEELQASLERIAKLEKLQQPNSCGLQSVDRLTDETGKSALEAMAISAVVHKLHKRVEDKDIDAQLAAELSDLYTRIESQSKSVETISNLVPEASKEVSQIKNPLKMKEPAKSLNYSKDALKIVSEETLFQGKAVAAMIQAVSAN